MIETLIIGITSFVGTNIDDLFLNALFFANAKTRREKCQVVLGKYVGMAALVAVSLLGAWGLQVLPAKVVRLAGLIPIMLGVKELAGNAKSGKTTGNTKEKIDKKFRNTALITIASGADNIGVYMPLFAGFDVWQMWIVLVVFFIMAGAWCYVGNLFTKLSGIQQFLDKHKGVLVPIVYIAIGVYILCK
jgi:cadmium resistance transport/sequestration family protein